jgi:hypothetical protein
MWNKKVFWGLTAKQLTFGIAVGATIGYGVQRVPYIFDYMTTDDYKDIKDISQEVRALRARANLLPKKSDALRDLDTHIAERELVLDKICEQVADEYWLACEVQKTWLRYRRQDAPKPSP